MNDMEKLLSASLSRSVERAPTAPSDLLHRVDATRRRRRRGTAAAGAAAVALVTVAGFVATNAISHARPAPAPASGPAKVEPIRKAWPAAVHTAPRTLPNGRPYTPERFLDKDTVLVRTLRDGHADRSDGLWAYHLDTRRAELLVAVQVPKGTVVSWSFTALGEGQLVWWTLRKDGERRVVDIWAAPEKGGAQRRVTSFEGRPGRAEIGNLAVVEGKVVWSMFWDGGLFRVPLSGGRPSKVEGTMGRHLLRWPWAASFQHPRRKKDLQTPPFGDLLNVLTGERRGVSLPVDDPRLPWNCVVTWCVRGDRAATRDGSRERELPGFTQDLPALDRFVTVTMTEGARPKGVALVDLATGKTGDLGIRPVGNEMAAPTLDYRAPGLLAYELGGKQILVNLTVAGR
ncbi:hypothetical protein GCM10010412_029830 [Nonomuraea recticatena]|uniref:Uncharacterized protein n=1 Tax=Nonomuraea recticatena TaxID=46178 RepID=A0ABN3RQR1_9ACTN